MNVRLKMMMQNYSSISKIKNIFLCILLRPLLLQTHPQRPNNPLRCEPRRNAKNRKRRR